MYPVNYYYDYDAPYNAHSYTGTRDAYQYGNMYETSPAGSSNDTARRAYSYHPYARMSPRSPPRPTGKGIRSDHRYRKPESKVCKGNNSRTSNNKPSSTPLSTVKKEKQVGKKEAPVRGNNEKKEKEKEKIKLRPGPQATPILSKGMTEYQKRAIEFVEKELKPLSGIKRIIFESVRKFGRLEMNDEGKIILLKNETEEQCIEGMSRLWQIGDGYIFVCQESGKMNEETGKPIVYIHVYHAGFTDYKKLSRTETEAIVSIDPFWKDEDIAPYKDLSIDGSLNH
jgi:hypothetical protein